MTQTNARRPDETLGDRDLTRWPAPIARLVDRLARRTHTTTGEVAVLLAVSLVGVAIMAFFTWACSEVYESVHDHAGLATLDRPVLDFMLAHRSPGLDTGVTWFTTFGGPIVTPIVGSAVIGFLALRWHTWLPVILMGVATTGSLAMTLVGKNYVGRVRPPHELAVPPYEWSPSFPSGHSLNSMVIGGVIAYLLILHVGHLATQVWIAVIAAAYSLLMGLSRIFLGHHWMTDVLVGWGLGAAWLAMLITVHRVAVTLRRHRREGA